MKSGPSGEKLTPTARESVLGSRSSATIDGVGKWSEEPGIVPLTHLLTTKVLGVIERIPSSDCRSCTVKCSQERPLQESSLVQPFDVARLELLPFLTHLVAPPEALLDRLDCSIS